jgi:hypothetical protein
MTTLVLAFLTATVACSAEDEPDLVADALSFFIAIDDT